MNQTMANGVGDDATGGLFESPLDRLALFADAARQSRRVRRLRRLLPAVSAVLLALVVGATLITRISISLSVGDLKITSAGLTMDAPHLSGSDGKGRTYSVTAANAVQDLSDTRIIRLSGIAASVVQADGRSAKLTADTGIYNSGAQNLVLEENIRLSNSDGSGGALDRAEINLNSGELTSDSPVNFSSDLGNINADRMGVQKNEGTITFSGGVHMTIDPTATRKDGSTDSLN